MEENLLATRAAAALRRISRNEGFKAHLMKTPELHDLLIKAASRFIGGESLAECLQVARTLQELGFGLSVDFMGESTRDRATAERATEEFLRIIEAFRQESGSFYISPDLSHLGLVIDPELAFENATRLAQAIHGAAGEVILNMEGTDRTDAILAMHKHICERYQNVGITLQAYLYRTPDDLSGKRWRTSSALRLSFRRLKKKDRVSGQ